MCTLYGKRNAFKYLMLVTIVMICGLSARRFSSLLPLWINLYLGDILWGLMIFFLFGLLFRARSTRVVAASALIFSYAVEISQLYHSQWIDSLRHTSIGGLVLGRGFLWSDLISYTLGIDFGLLIERRLN
ncbi:Protein of unknown function (DUF2809) [Desulfosporosinus meridiei DSM 13257]|uniref:DUF2809 domain-containing protein n=1 Tax=Desulfosporosinus meridiei (strain ATCC BAA-275 / DSM 13257 / KCTC 12902 / NCIMB 13706 / S10) TaxID=768704 RepID=J7IX43_DESMD|nr:Protein of unknown function (DUF2809) [Desulfosporosinus meridiei DSM 13257]